MDLRGKTVNVEVYLFIPKDERPRSYVWGINEKIVSAGMMETADAVIKDIAESYRKREPEYIELSFPAYIPPDLEKRWDGQLRRGLQDVQIMSFQKALKGCSGIGLASEEE